MALPNSGKAITGARAKLSITTDTGEQEIGWAMGLSVQENIQQQPIEILGFIDPVEIEAVGRSVSLTVDYIRITSESLQSLGIWPGHSADDAVATKTVLGFGEMTATIYDQADEKVLYKIEGMKPQSRSFRVARGGIMTLNSQFIARKLYDQTNAG